MASETYRLTWELIVKAADVAAEKDATVEIVIADEAEMVDADVETDKNRR